MKTKKAIIVVNLIEESVEKANQQIEKEIWRELTHDLLIVPWVERIEKITVTERPPEQRVKRKKVY